MSYSEFKTASITFFIFGLGFIAFGLITHTWAIIGIAVLCIIFSLRCYFLIKQDWEFLKEPKTEVELE